MIDNATLPSPFCVSVLENYFNERPHNVVVDISKLPVDHGYRRAVIDALNGKGYVQVSYDTLGSYSEHSAGVSGKVEIEGSVTLTEDSKAEYDGYTVPEDWDEEDLAEYLRSEKEAKAAEASTGISAEDRRWIAQMYHGPRVDLDRNFLARRFNTTPEIIDQIAKEYPPEPPAKDILGLMGGMF